MYMIYSPFRSTELERLRTLLISYDSFCPKSRRALLFISAVSVAVPTTMMTLDISTFR